MENIDNKWIQSRRDFFKNTSVLLVGASLPWLLKSCSSDKMIDGLKVFDSSQYSILKSIHEVLFPRDQFGPGANDLRSVEYLDWVLSDKYIDESDKKYMLNGIRWFKESAEEELDKSIEELSSDEIITLVDIVSKSSWGKSWLSRNLTYIFEANFSDELYGSNIGGKGWDWLDHYPGYPRPTVDQIYDNIFDSLSNSIYNRI